MAKYFVNPTTGEIDYFKDKVSVWKASHPNIVYYQDKKALLKAIEKDNPELRHETLKTALYKEKKLPTVFTTLHSQLFYKPELEEEEEEEEEEYYGGDYAPELTLLDKVEYGYIEVSDLSKNQLNELQKELKSFREYAGQPRQEYMTDNQLAIYSDVQDRFSALTGTQPKRINSRLRRESGDISDIIAKFSKS